MTDNALRFRFATDANCGMPATGAGLLGVVGTGAAATAAQSNAVSNLHGCRSYVDGSGVEGMGRVCGSSVRSKYDMRGEELWSPISKTTHALAVELLIPASRAKCAMIKENCASLDSRATEPCQ